jgi:hypothetical protein
MEQEIKRAQAVFADRPMLINTMCSGIGAPTAALKETAASSTHNQQHRQHVHPPSSIDITACNHQINLADSVLTGDADPVHRDMFVRSQAYSDALPRGDVQAGFGAIGRASLP